jgi:hypothetical protein
MKNSQAVLMSVQVTCDAMLCERVSGTRDSEQFALDRLTPDDWGTTVLQNIENHSPKRGSITPQKT